MPAVDVGAADEAVSLCAPTKAAEKTAVTMARDENSMAERSALGDGCPWFERRPTPREFLYGVLFLELL